MNNSRPIIQSHPVQERRAARRTPILLFPGQSSIGPGALEVAVALNPEVTLPLVEEASERLQRDLRAEARDWAERPTNRTIQVTTFLASHLHLAALRAAGLPPGPSAGLSLGEYNHLVDIGALDFRAAVALVDARGQRYDQGPRGVMVALFPAQAAVVQEAITQRGGEVAISNYNSPEQQVIAGDREAVMAVADALDEAHFVDARLIEGQLPMHSPTFRPVARALTPDLAAAPLQAPRRPYLPNVLGHPVEGATPDDIRCLLARHVHEPVRWRQSIDWLAEHTARPLFIEVGPGRVLTGLLRRSWRAEPRFDTSCIETFLATLEALRSEDLV